MAGDEVKKPAVPKFASFKPKSEKAQESSCSTDPRDTPKEHRKGSSNREDRERHRSRHPRSQSDRDHRDRRDRQRASSPEKREPKSAPSREEPLFVVDKRGDPLIVKYGSNDRSKVPIYRRSGAGRVLGGQGRIRLIYDGPRQLFSLGDKTGEGTSAFRDRNLLAKASRKKTKVFRLRPDADQASKSGPDDNVDFLPLSEGHHQKKGSHDNGETMEEDGPDYRSIQGKAKARDFVDSDLESADTSDGASEEGIGAPNPARQRSAELSRHLKEHPDDIDSWMQLVDIQATILGIDESSQMDSTSDEAKGLANVRVSLLEEALSSIRDTSDREILFLRLMREGSRAWSNKTLAKRWDDIKFEGSSFSLWKAHLNHKMRQMTTLTYDGLKGIHLERMRFVGRKLFDAAKMSPSNTEAKTSIDLTSICHELIYVFARMTCFLRDAGYSELAVAAWQAALEIAFACPHVGERHEPDDLTRSFQNFWESEVRRMGEAGAQGWRNFDAEDISEPPDPSQGPPMPLLDTRDAYRAWAAVEKRWSESASLPARTLDEGIEDDPFRIVMFSDLEPLLLWWPPGFLEQSDLKMCIHDAFLLFCGLPTASRNCSRILQEMREDPYILRQKTGLNEASFERESHTEDGAKKPPRFTDPGSRLSASYDVFFPGQDWFGFFTYDASPEHDLALTVTTQLATSFGFEPVAEYSLGLAWNKDPANIRKVAKALLKKWPNNTSLYNAYAVAEWRHGRQDVARNVLLSATSQELPGKELLWTTWAWLDLEAEDMNSALAHCVAASATASPIGSEVSTTYSQLLKARQTLSSSRGFLLSVGNLDQAVLFAQAGVLLEYLSDSIDSAAGSPPPRQGNIDTAMKTIHTFTAEATDRGHATSPALERLFQFAAHLLYLHAARGPFRPTYLRDQLRHFLLLFPSNTIFLRLFAWADTSILLNDPVRDLLRDPVLSPAHDCVTSRTFALQHEARAGTVHSVAAGFERAVVDSDACHGNVGLWLDYVRFCYSQRLSTSSASSSSVRKNEKAKDVYYRAIGSCPWSKELAMEAFAPAMVKGMDSAELRSVFHTVANKGLRIHIDLEDFVADWSKTRKGKDLA